MQTPPHLEQLRHVVEQEGIIIEGAGYKEPVTQTLLRRGCIEAMPTAAGTVELQPTSMGRIAAETGIMPPKAGTVAAWMPQNPDEGPYIALFPRKEGDRVLRRTYYIQSDIDQSNNRLVDPLEPFDWAFSPVDDLTLLFQYADLMREFQA